MRGHGAERGGAAFRLALWAQRRAHVVPAPLRRSASDALQRLGRGRPGLPRPSEVWSVPLVAGRPGGNLETLAAEAAIATSHEAETVAISATATTAASDHAARPTAAGSARLRCAIATGVLDVGGAEEFAAFLSRHLARHGFDTAVAYSGRRLPGQRGAGGRLADELAGEGVAIVELSPETATDWLRAHRPDVISAHYAPDWLLDSAAALGVPWVETLHGMHSFFHPDSWGTERRRAQRISAQVAVSDLVRRQYIARNPSFPTDRIITVPNGVDRTRVAEVDRARARSALGLEDEFLFVSLARYCLQKNTYGLVTAFADVAAEHPDAHLLVAGRADDPLYFAQTLQMAQSLPFAERIHLRGHCTNPTALLAAADAFVLDSFFEGWSLSSMEALVAGTPVILSDVGGAREQLTGSDTRGFLVANPGGPPELVDWERISRLRFRTQDNRGEFVAAMSSMVRDRKRWAAARGRLREDAIHLFSADACLGRHAQVLRAVANGEPLCDPSTGTNPARSL
jgi:glycosyltransferase involved in cell wall biosynthesis